MRQLIIDFSVITLVYAWAGWMSFLLTLLISDLITDYVTEKIKQWR